MSRSSTSASKKKKSKDVAKTPAEIKREKLQQEYTYQSEDAKSMRAEIRQMRGEIENETRLLNDFQMQKAKIDSFHEIAKKTREDLKLSLRNSLRQKQDLEEKQAYELKIYKQKVKHLLHEQQSNMTELRIDNEENLTLVETQSREQEHSLSLENRSIKVALKENENLHWDYIKTLKIEQEKSILELRTEYERKNYELKEHYEKKQKSVRDEYEDKRRDIVRIELKKNTHISDLMSQHARKFDKIKKYYSDITHANLELIKNLKEEVGDMKKKEAAVQKEVNDIRKINKKLSKPLQRNRKLVESLKADLEQYKQDKIYLGGIQSQVTQYEDLIKQTEWEYEISQQKYLNLQEEKEEVEKSMNKKVFKGQQKTGFKNLLLEKKLTAMAQDLEKTESALAEVLASTNLHPEIIGDIQHNLEDVLMSKNRQTQKLQESIDELKAKYERTVRVYESKLREYQIPVEELGFTATRRL